MTTLLERTRILLSFRLAYRHFRAHLGRLALSILAVALGVALVVAVQLMNAAVLESFLDAIDGMAGRASLSIRAGGGHAFDESVLDAVKEVPGVALAVPLVTAVAFPDDGSGEVLTVQGLDITNDDAVRVYHRGRRDGIVDDEITFLNSRTSLIVTHELAQRRGLQLGSTLPLVTPTGVQTFTVRGFLQPEGLAKTLGGRLVVMDLYAAEAAFARPGQINQIDLLVVPGHEATVRAAVAATLPAGLTIEEPALRKDVVRRTVGGLQSLLSAFAFLAVLAGFVVCYGRLATVFEARTWETGVLRAVGLGRGAVFGELLKESLLLGLAGAALGVLLGVGIAIVGLPAVATTTALQFRLPTAMAQPTFAWSAVGGGLGVAIVASLLAATAPALRLARTPPLDALRMTGREAPATNDPPRSRLCLVLVTAVALLVVAQVLTQLTVLGVATSSLMALGACLAARPLVQQGGRLLLRSWGLLFGPTGRFAAAHLTQHARRSTLTIATLGIGLGAVGMFGLLAKSLEGTVIAELSGRLKADLVVTSSHVSGGWVNAPLADTILEELRELPGVAGVSGQRRSDITHEGREAAVDGYDATAFRDPRLFAWDLDGPRDADALEQVARGDAVLVTVPFARQFRVNAGSRLVVQSPQGPQELYVAAITRGEPIAAVVMSRERYARSWTNLGLLWTYLTLAPDADEATVARTVRGALGERHRIHVRPVRELIDYFGAQVRQAFAFLDVMELMTFALVLVGIGDTLTSGVVERTRELGTLRALGLPRSRLCALVVLEGLGIGTLGLVLGAMVAATLGGFWLQVQFPALVGWSIDPHLPTGLLATATVITLLLCIASSVLPALRASRIRIAVALRSD